MLEGKDITRTLHKYPSERFIKPYIGIIEGWPENASPHQPRREPCRRKGEGRSCTWGQSQGERRSQEGTKDFRARDDGVNKIGLQRISGDPHTPPALESRVNFSAYLVKMGRLGHRLTLVHRSFVWFDVYNHPSTRFDEFNRYLRYTIFARLPTICEFVTQPRTTIRFKESSVTPVLHLRWMQRVMPRDGGPLPGVQILEF
eukprot:1186563-Prorocentrum_minimum.AAC.4